MEKKLLFVFNPHSGKAQLKNKLVDILDLFVKNGYTVTVHPTQGKADATEIVRQKAGGYDLIVCSGGDGTINEVVDGLMLADNQPPVGYIPSGTVNDFASSLHLPRNLMHAATVVMTGTPFAYDVGGFNDEFFSYIAAFGIFTDVAYKTPQQSKNLLGGMAYFLEGAKRLYNVKSYHMVVRHDDEVLEDDYIVGLVTNSTSVGGFKGFRGKGVMLDDGLFEVSLIKTPQNAIELQSIITALMKKEINQEYITSFRTSRIEFWCDEEVPWTLDGEDGGAASRVLIRNFRRAVRVIVNPEKVVEKIDKDDQEVVERA